MARTVATWASPSALRQGSKQGDALVMPLGLYVGAAIGPASTVRAEPTACAFEHVSGHLKKSLADVLTSVCKWH